jgi:shikimate kinase
MSKSIVLIGPPGAGKSTIGKQLARSLNSSFSDTDDIIESQTGSTISQIFIDQGEPWFRKLEEEVVLQAISDLDGVLSLGGGAPLSQNAQDKIRSISSPVIFLDVSLATAAPRVGFNRDRPLLLSNPRAAWQELMDKRRPIYESLATQIVSVDGLSPKEVVAKIVEVVGESA